MRREGMDDADGNTSRNFLAGPSYVNTDAKAQFLRSFIPQPKGDCLPSPPSRGSKG